MMDNRLRVLLITVLLLAGGTVSCLEAQEKQETRPPDSPVFKSYRPPSPVLPEHSDPTHQIWQAFLAARKANAGDAVAMFELGNRYLAGQGVEVDTVKAAHWFERAANGGVTPARYNMGILFYHGWGVPWNPFAAFKAFLVCAEQGMPEAEHIVGMFYVENLVVPRDVDRARTWLQRAADRGYAPARESLKDIEESFAPRAPAATTPDGAVNVAGQFTGIQDDSTKTDPSILLKSAFARNDPTARRALGIASMLEGSVPPDTVMWRGLQEAADAGSPEALAVLGKAYEAGSGVPVDLVRAAGMFLRAIRNDSPRAGAFLLPLLERPGFFEELKTRSRRDDAEACFVWGMLVALEAGQLLMQHQAYLTESQGLGMLERASDAHHLPARNELGLCYYTGRWVERDEARGKSLWRESAQAGSVEAEVRIAAVTVRTMEDSASLRTAVATLQRTIEQGSLLAEVALGYCYEVGKGVQGSPAEAARHYRTAAGRGSQDAYRALLRMHDTLRPQDKEYKLAEEGGG
jgi:TPR repeat protein